MFLSFHSWILSSLLHQQLLKQRQMAEDKALEQVHRLQSEKRTLQEHVGTLQRAYANLEADKRELERNSGRLEKDKTALKKTLDKVNNRYLEIILMNWWMRIFQTVKFERSCFLYEYLKVSVHPLLCGPILCSDFKVALLFKVSLSVLINYLQTECCSLDPVIRTI